MNKLILIALLYSFVFGQSLFENKLFFYYRELMKHIFILIALKSSFLFAQFELDEYHNWIGKTFPDIEFSSVDGNQNLLSEINADVILLDFWYVACHPCLKAFPDIQEIQNKYPKEKLAVLMLNPIDHLKAVKAFQEDYNYTFEYGVVLEELFFEELKMAVMPRTIILDNNRKVLLDVEGFWGDKSVKKYETTIESIISSKKQFWEFWE